MGAAAAAILVLSLAGVLLRPRDIHESAYAAGGALLMIVAGIEPLGGAAHVLRTNVATLAFLAGVMLLATAADAAGLFTLAARGAVRVSGGRTSRLFWLVVAVAFVGTAVLSLDAVAVALTPVVLTVAARCDAPAEPLLFACIAVANSASMALPGANPTNVVVTSRVGLDFISYAAVMVPVALAASLAVAVVLRLRFRRDLREPFRVGRELEGRADPRLVVLLVIIVAATLTGFAVTPHELGWVALAGGTVAALASVGRRALTGRAALAGTSPRLLLFALGMFVLVDGAERHGLRSLVLDHAPATTVGFGLSAAALANVVNNLPATVLLLPALHGDATRAYAALVGVDAGPNLALTGSLATLLWLTLVRERDIQLDPRRFLAIGLLTAPAGLAAALLTLWGVR